MPHRPAASPVLANPPGPTASRFTRPWLSSWARRLTYFWLVWSALLLVHEGGHALSAWRQGLTVSDVTGGRGPVIGRSEVHGTSIVRRLGPVAGVTDIGGPGAGVRGSVAPPGAGSPRAAEAAGV